MSKSRMMVLLAAVSLPLPTLSQNAAAPLVEEVVVTAQKRSENVQDVPISMAVFSGAALETAGVDDVRDLRRITPNLYIATAPQVTNTRVSMRGIGTSGNTAIEPSVAFFLDGIYVPRVGSMLAGLNDVESVEVLRGPQGTLFGRNASVGAISLRSVAPRDHLEAEMSGEMGSFGYWKSTGTFNAPLNDDVAVRLALLGEHTDGTGYEELSDKRLGENDVFSARLSGRWNIADNLTWTTRVDYQTADGDGAQAISVVSETVTPTAAANWRQRLDPDGAGPLTGDLPLIGDTYSRRVRQDSGGTLDDEQVGLSSDLSWDLGGDWSARLLAGYRDWRNEQFQNSTGNQPLPLTDRLGTFDSESLSGELQLLSPDDLFDGKASFVAGLYYYDETFRIGEVIGLLPAYCNVFIRNTQPARLAACLSGAQQNSSVLAFDQDTESHAGYVQGTYRFTEAWDVTAGVRYSNDDKQGSFVQQSFNSVSARATETTLMALEQDKVTYRLGTSYRPVDNMMLFATYATGYKSGGFDSGGGATVGGLGRIFLPETVDNYELGVKSELLDRRLTMNATLYWTLVEDLQFRTYDGVSFRVRNNGKIRQRGVEFDLVGRPSRAWLMTLSGAYLDSEYLEFRGAPGLPAFGGTQDLTGEPAPYSPEFQGAGAVQYEMSLPWGDLSVRWRGDVSYLSEINLSSAGDNNPDAMEPEHALFGARIALVPGSERWELALVGQNLTDELSCGTRYSQPQDQALGLRNPVTGGTVLRCTLSEPRTFQIAAKINFR